jgi:hypothetical protein
MLQVKHLSQHSFARKSVDTTIIEIPNFTTSHHSNHHNVPLPSHVNSPPFQALLE